MEKCMENTVEEHNIERTVRMTQPKTLVFGCGCASQLASDLTSRGLNHAMVVTAKAIRRHANSVADQLKAGGLSVLIDESVNEEPTIAMLERILAQSNSTKIDVVVGIGGGSVLDVAKLVAALRDGKQRIGDCFGIGKLAGRKIYLVCLPTTSGTGSEVSPNAILLDETDEMKKGVVSPYLVPDASYVDPALTLTTPDQVTASTGIDALTHCIEAYANRFAHPMIDVFALKGIELIAGSLEAAYQDGENLRARSALSLGSMYGGLCLGPVNTAAVHALAYPLGGRFHVPHGLSNAILLPDIMEFNLSAAPQRYARIAMAMGCEETGDNLLTAQRGIVRIRELCRRCGIISCLSDFGVQESDIPDMAQSAMGVTRLLKNNLKSVTQEDAERIYRNLLRS
jgi:alcohol dehydrogenase class IV